MEAIAELTVPVEGDEMARLWERRFISYTPTLQGEPLRHECGLFGVSDSNLGAVLAAGAVPVRVVMRLGGATLWEFRTRDDRVWRLVCSGYGVGHRGGRVRALAARLAPLARVPAGRLYRRLARLELGFFGLLWDAGWSIEEMPAPR